MMERARRKREAKADHGCFTVRMPVIFTISLVSAIIVFTVIAVFFTRQVIEKSDSGIPWSQILSVISVWARSLFCALFTPICLYVRK